MLVGCIYNFLIIPSQHQRIQHPSSQSNKHCPKENLPPAAHNNMMFMHVYYIIKKRKETVNSKQCLPGKNLQEKLRKEMGDIESDNKAQ